MGDDVSADDTPEAARGCRRDYPQITQMHTDERRATFLSAQICVICGSIAYGIRYTNALMCIPAPTEAKSTISPEWKA
jgi:hypothetical protein